MHHRGRVCEARYDAAMNDGRINVLLVGGGGREHALATAMSRSPRLGRLHVTHPTNPGLAALGTGVDVPVDAKQLYRLAQYCDKHRVDLVVIGPDNPLAEGYADALAGSGRVVFGPTAAGARIESDKAWAKQVMRSASIPTAEGRAFREYEAARAYLESRETPQVIKASGLALGKGVVVPGTLEEGLRALEDIMVRRVHGVAGETVVIEERLSGPERSVFAVVDGRSITVLDPCRDYKRLGDGDVGPNTGGMGAVCSPDLLDARTMERIEREILVPTVDALRREGIDYRGVLYAGLMLTHAGPKVLEFNCRFGDPECQALVPRMEGDLLEMMLAAAQRRLGEAEMRWRSGASVCVVLASEGYPAKPVTGRVIEGLDEAAAMPDVHVFHAGTARDREGRIMTSGGRVLSVVGVGEDVGQARARAYAACEVIRFEGKVMRRDIGAS